MSHIYEFEIDDGLIPHYRVFSMRNTDNPPPLRFDDYVLGYELICQTSHIPLTPEYSRTKSAIRFAAIGRAVRLGMIEDVWEKPIKFLWPLTACHKE